MLGRVLMVAVCAATITACAHPANPCQQFRVVKAAPSAYDFADTPTRAWDVELDDGHSYRVAFPKFTGGAATGDEATLCAVVSKIDGSIHYSVDSTEADRTK